MGSNSELAKLYLETLICESCCLIFYHILFAFSFLPWLIPVICIIYLEYTGLLLAINCFIAFVLLLAPIIFLMGEYSSVYQDYLQLKKNYQLWQEYRHGL